MVTRLIWRSVAVMAMVSGSALAAETGAAARSRAGGTVSDQDRALVDGLLAEIAKRDSGLRASWEATLLPAPTAAARGASQASSTIEMVVGTDELWSQVAPVATGQAESLEETLIDAGTGQRFTRNGRGSDDLLTYDDATQLAGAMARLSDLAQLDEFRITSTTGSLRAALRDAREVRIDRDGTRVFVRYIDLLDADRRIEHAIVLETRPVAHLVSVASAPVNVPATSEAFGILGSELTMSDFRTVGNRFLPGIADERTRVRFPGSREVEEQVTRFVLTNADVSHVRPSDLVSFDLWEAGASGIFDGRIGAGGELGAEAVVVNGIRHRLERPLRARDFRERTNLLALCVAEVTSATADASTVPVDRSPPVEVPPSGKMWSLWSGGLGAAMLATGGIVWVCAMLVGRTGSRREPVAGVTS